MKFRFRDKRKKTHIDKSRVLTYFLSIYVKRLFHSVKLTISLILDGHHKIAYLRQIAFQEEFRRTTIRYVEFSSQRTIFWNKIEYVFEKVRDFWIDRSIDSIEYIDRINL